MFECTWQISFYLLDQIYIVYCSDKKIKKKGFPFSWFLFFFFGVCCYNHRQHTLIEPIIPKVTMFLLQDEEPRNCETGMPPLTSNNYIVRCYTPLEVKFHVFRWLKHREEKPISKTFSIFLLELHVNLIFLLSFLNNILELMFLKLKGSELKIDAPKK